MSGKSYQTEVKKIKLEDNKEKLTSIGAVYENLVVRSFTSLCKDFSTKQLDDRNLQAHNYFSNTSKIVLTIFLKCYFL